MSKLPHAQYGVMHDIQCMTHEELQDKYGIEIDEYGEVWDSCEFKAFTSLQSWGVYMQKLEQEEQQFVQMTSKKRSSKFDDDIA